MFEGPGPVQDVEVPVPVIQLSWRRSSSETDQPSWEGQVVPPRSAILNSKSCRTSSAAGSPGTTLDACNLPGTSENAPCRLRPLRSRRNVLLQQGSRPERSGPRGFATVGSLLDLVRSISGDVSQVRIVIDPRDSKFRDARTLADVAPRSPVGSPPMLSSSLGPVLVVVEVEVWFSSSSTDDVRGHPRHQKFDEAPFSSEQ